MRAITIAITYPLVLESKLCKQLSNGCDKQCDKCLVQEGREDLLDVWYKEEKVKQLERKPKRTRRDNKKTG